MNPLQKSFLPDMPGPYPIAFFLYLLSFGIRLTIIALTY